MPILFACEDNGLAIHSERNARTPNTPYSERISSYGIDVSSFSYEDPKELSRGVDLAVEKVRENNVQFLIVKCFRWMEHVGVGFDWDKKEEVIEKVYEEIKELKEELKLNDEKKTKQELGDLIFSVINMARFINIDPEEALESTNIKFISRFQYMEKKIAKDKKNLKEMSLNEMNKYWNSSKKIHG